MGFVKREFEEWEERCWDPVDTFVCQDCVEDKYLRQVISTNATSASCSYCGAQAGAIVAPFESVMAPIADAVSYFYNEPTQAGVPYEGGWLLEPIDTDDVLESIGLECHDEIRQDIINAFSNDAWVPSAYGHWASSHDHEIYSYSWSAFSE